MSRSFSFITLIVVVAAGGYLYSRQALPIPGFATNAKTTVDLIGVRNDLLALAQAEKRFFAVKFRFAGTLEELRDETGIFIPSRPEYKYTTQADENTFRITATYSGDDPAAPRKLTIDEKMNLRE
ncbi:MAG TPA: hypothetical protein VFY29_04745 [Terriglobia bacterium]|nr:hypothetical protein [Terriglobia bacterium]